MMRPAFSLLLVLALLLGTACRVAPNDPLFEPCADASGKDTALHLTGTGDLEDIALSGDNAFAEVITQGDYVRAARTWDPAIFELEARFPNGESLALTPGEYRTADDSLLELSVDLFTEERSFEGGGMFWLADERPYWMAVFELTEVQEGFGATGDARTGTLAGCLVARSPFARAEVMPPRLRPTPTPME